MFGSSKLILAIVAGCVVASNAAEEVKPEPKWLWPGIRFPLPALNPPASATPPATATCDATTCCKDFFYGIIAGDTCTAGTPPMTPSGAMSATKCVLVSATCTTAACTTCSTACAPGPTVAICRAN